MSLYTFHLFAMRGVSTTLDAVALRNDGEAFDHAGRLLDRHPTCERVEVWNGNRAVVARHREQPIIRPFAVTA